MKSSSNYSGKIFLLCLTLVLSAKLGSQTTYTFTSGGATGTTMPTQTQINTTYTNTSLSGLVTVSLGIQSWTVPASGIYRIAAYGAKGGNGGGTGGSGAVIQGDFNLIGGQVLKILVGQPGVNGSYQGGGGGGSFVSTLTNTALCVAGGGGGGYYSSYSSGAANMSGTVSNSGNGGYHGNNGVVNGTGGANGSGGNIGSNGSGSSQGSAGGGFFGDGGSGYGTTGGTAFINGGAAGVTNQSGTYAGHGGFGGGGASDASVWWGAGGGGGYSGGGAGFWYGCGGGGGSYNGGTNQSNSSGSNAGNGKVIITRLSGISIVQTASVTCSGQANAALTASVFGGTAPYTYSWSTGATSSVVSGLGAGTYTCSGTDALSIVFTNTFTVTEPTVLSSSITSQTNLTCNGASNGQLIVTAYGGTSPYTYSWSPSGGTAATSTGLAAGTYLSYVRDANNCLSVQFATITQPAPITVQGFATTGTVCPGQSSILVGASALTYTWSHGVTNGVPFYPTATAVYTVTGTNSSGCNGTATTAIVVNPLPNLAISGASMICLGGSTTLSATGANSYTWSTSSNATSIAITPVSTTAYTLSGTNGFGCSTSLVQNVTVLNTSPAVTANSTNTSVCIGNQTSLYGGGATTYAWSGGITDNTAFSPSASGSYTVTGYNACGSGTNSIYIAVNSLPNITASASSNSVCYGSAATLNGGGGVSYSWTGGVTNNSAFIPSSTANYTVTGTDANGCQNTANKTITVNALPSIVAYVTNSVVCLGNTTAFYGSGGLFYSWSGGITNNTAFAPGASGTYVVTGTDGNGCQNTASESVTVIQVPALTANSSTSSVCSGNYVTLSATGALSYTWTGGATNNVAFVPGATATYTVYGSNSCGTTSNVVSVTVNPSPNVTANASSTVTCFNTPITLFGGGASTYTWSGGISNNVAFTPISSANYTVTGTDVNGCQNTAVKSLTVVSLPVVTASASSSAFCLGNTTTLNGGGASTYTWSGGVINNTAFSPTLTTAYTVTGTAVSGCKNTAVKTITVYQLPTVYASASNPVICKSNSTSFYASGANTYTWTGGITNGAIIFPTVTTTYSVSGTNTLTGCTSTNNAFATVTVNPLPSLTITPSSTLVCAGQALSLLASGANTYSWSNFLSNGVAFIPPGTTGYFVTGTNTLTGCQNMAYYTVTVSALPTVTATVSNNNVCAGTTIVFNGAGAHTYTWNAGIVNGAPFVAVASGNYYVTGTNTLTGCTSTNISSQYVNVNTSPTLNISLTTPTVCVGIPVTVNTTGADSYTWTGGITNGVPFIPLVTTVYTVIGTSTVTGCTTTLTKTIVVNPTPQLAITSTVTAACIGSPITLIASGADTYTWTGGVVNGVAFSPTAGATYSVQGKNNTTGCVTSNTLSIHIPLYPPPTISSSVSAAAVCKGDAVIFSSSGADVYTWTSGPVEGVPYSPTQTDTYFVSGTNTLTGCTSTNVSSQMVIVYPVPLLNVSVTNSLICSGESTTLTVGSTSSYTWNTGETTSTISVSPSVTTVYSANVKNSNNCVNSASITVDVSDCTGLTAASKNLGLLIYPNPNTGSFTIKGEANISLQIVNDLGQVIKTFNLDETNVHEISVQDLSAGIYFAIGQSTSRQIKQKIVITK